MKSVIKTLVLMTALSGALWANEEAHEEAGHSEAAHEASHEEGKSFDPKAMILHHVGDSHEFHILGEGESSVSLPLPIILWTDAGLVTFMSSAFHHDMTGAHVVERKGLKFVNYHDKIYQLTEGDVLDVNHATHEAKNGVKPLDFSITKNVFSMFLSVGLLLFIFLSVAKNYKKRGVTSTTKGLQSFIEPLIVFVRDDIARPNIPSNKVNKYLPYLLTVFFFIWINNLMGLIPIFPGSANLTGNIAFTMILAVITFIITNVSGNKAYWGHVFATPGVPFWLAPIMIPVELLGLLTKPIALMIRLFANITAGHIIILSLVSLIFIFENVAWGGLSVPLALFISVLELLVAALQAFVFTLLSALFIGMAVEDHH